MASTSVAPWRRPRTESCWRGQHNLYAEGEGWVAYSFTTATENAQRKVDALAAWKKFWGSAETGSREGRARYKGGDVHTRMDREPENLTPEDFRARSDSAARGAGVGGRDLGADVDLVGPGHAYERWQKTPEYQQWLKVSGQVK